MHVHPVKPMRRRNFKILKDVAPFCATHSLNIRTRSAFLNHLLETNKNRVLKGQYSYWKFSSFYCGPQILYKKKKRKDN